MYIVLNEEKTPEMDSGSSLEGDWNSTKDCCGFGYSAVWKITVTGDNMVMREQSGSHCCFFVPNPILKTHRMEREDENTWAGTLGCRRIYVKKVGEDELRHWTTDGWFTLVRAG